VGTTCPISQTSGKGKENLFVGAETATGSGDGEAGSEDGS